MAWNSLLPYFYLADSFSSCHQDFYINVPFSESSFQDCYLLLSMLCTAHLRGAWLPSKFMLMVSVRVVQVKSAQPFRVALVFSDMQSNNPPTHSQSLYICIYFSPFIFLFFFKIFFNVCF